MIKQNVFYEIKHKLGTKFFVIPTLSLEFAFMQFVFTSETHGYLQNDLLCILIEQNKDTVRHVVNNQARIIGKFLPY